MVNYAWYDTAQLLKIEKAKKESDWFTAIVLSAVQLERHGCLEIKEYLENLNVKSELIDRILKRKYLYEIAEYLMVIGKIDSEECKTIKTVNEERNNFIHRRGEERFKRGLEAKDKYAPLIDDAIRILKEKLNVLRIFIGKS